MRPIVLPGRARSFPAKVQSLHAALGDRVLWGVQYNSKSRNPMLIFEQDCQAMSASPSAPLVFLDNETLGYDSINSRDYLERNAETAEMLRELGHNVFGLHGLGIRRLPYPWVEAHIRRCGFEAMTPVYYLRTDDAAPRSMVADSIVAGELRVGFAPYLSGLYNGNGAKLPPSMMRTIADQARGLTPCCVVWVDLAAPLAVEGTVELCELLLAGVTT